MCATTWSGGGAPHAVWSSVVWASLTRVASYPLTNAPWSVERTHGIGLCANDDESPNSEARQHGLESGVLEGVAVVLLNERLRVARSQLGDDPPGVAPPRSLLIGVLDPDNRDPFAPRLLDEAGDVRLGTVAATVSRAVSMSAMAAAATSWLVGGSPCRCRSVIRTQPTLTEMAEYGPSTELGRAAADVGDEERSVISPGWPVPPSPR